MGEVSYDWALALFCPRCGAGPDEGFERIYCPGEGPNGEDIERVQCSDCETYFGSLIHKKEGSYEVDTSGYAPFGDVPRLQPDFSSFEELIKYCSESLPPSSFNVEGVRSVLRDTNGPPIKRGPIKHVVFDADDTMWSVIPWGIVSLCDENSYKRVSEDVLECQHYFPMGVKKKKKAIAREAGATGEQEGCQVVLMPTMRDTIRALHERGIGMSVASHNDKEPVVEALRALEILKDFSAVKASSAGSKAMMVEQIAAITGVAYEHILFIDDSYYNVEDVRHAGAQTLWMGVQIHEPYEIIAWIDGANQ